MTRPRPDTGALTDTIAQIEGEEVVESALKQQKDSDDFFSNDIAERADELIEFIKQNPWVALYATEMEWRDQQAMEKSDRVYPFTASEMFLRIAAHSLVLAHIAIKSQREEATR